MGRRQTATGKAFEFALADALHGQIGRQQCVLVRDGAYDVASGAFGTMGRGEQKSYRAAAGAAIRHMVLLEPRLTVPGGMSVRIQRDVAGQRGDVRDVLAVQQAADHGEWTVGFSAKNNHEALKHSRLSETIDFGQRWMGVPCSEHYMSQAGQIFGRVHDLMDSGSCTLWSEVAEKHAIYGQILDAFQAELTRLSGADDRVPPRLVQYLLGSHDFYKIIKRDEERIVRVQGFNLRGDLGRPAPDGTRPRIKVPKLELPTRLREITKRGSTTLRASLDNGWEVSFRIHNASSKLEASLKFDVQLVGMPQRIYTSDQSWGNGR
ncbi:MAG: HaeIII family restriction endonuclease [Thaumarchaeota archaeon]|nr:HaeIII family restriction endonuclease [Nitrososphaerota archaeon]